MSEVRDMKIQEQAVGISVYRLSPLSGYTSAELHGGAKAIDTFFRRVRLIGGTCNQDSADGLADIFDSNMDTIETIFLTRKGVLYCYKKLGLRVIRWE